MRSRTAISLQYAPIMRSQANLLSQNRFWRYFLPALAYYLFTLPKSCNPKTTSYRTNHYSENSNLLYCNNLHHHFFAKQFCGRQGDTRSWRPYNIPHVNHADSTNSVDITRGIPLVRLGSAHHYKGHVFATTLPVAAWGSPYIIQSLRRASKATFQD